MTALFVGDQPSPKMLPGAMPFEGASCEWRFKDFIQYLRITEYKVENSIDFSYSFGWPSSIGLIWAALGNHPIIALGNAASKRLRKIPHFKLPHPSGLNRKLNNQEWVDSELDRCYRWLKEKQCVTYVSNLNLVDYPPNKLSRE